MALGLRLRTKATLWLLAWVHPVSMERPYNHHTVCAAGMHTVALELVQEEEIFIIYASFPDKTFHKDFKLVGTGIPHT
ncbi:hypothetical protein C8R45DRAFT_1089337 [Mycena sanguinolenta]|nr:hypothetical protein C8R45DRAFT_1089337 [Mycena sanguinolenta]